MAGPLSALPERIAEVLALDPAAHAIEYEGEWTTWGDIAATVEQVAALIEPGTEVGVLLRNRPASIGLLLGVLRAGGCLVTINPGRGPDRVRTDIADLDVAWIAGEPDDVRALVPDVVRSGVAATANLARPIEIVREPLRPAGRGRPGAAVRMLTSGTTGPPKRIDLSYRMLERVLAGAKHYESNTDQTPRLRSGIAVVNSPLVHLGGLFRVLQCICDGRSFALLPRFTVEGWVDAVRRHRPNTASLVPTALRMVLDADVDPVALASLRAVVSGTAPLDPDDADAFLDRYGVPVLVSYAATEFGGGVAGWTLADHRVHWSAKRGSVGRAHPGCELRVIDPDSGSVVASGDAGVLEVKAHQLDEGGWMRTTDLARLDEDGFLWILGRADQAIIRGGFKVHPDDVRRALERHPSVTAAAVVRRDDRRLGAVPIAAVELRRDQPPVTGDELTSYVAGALAPYEVPALIAVVDELPRTPSGKADLAAVGDLLSNADGD